MKKQLVMAMLSLSIFVVGCGNSSDAQNEESTVDSTEVAAEVTDIEETEAAEEVAQAEEESETTEVTEDNGVTEMSATKYANCEVNVRSGASTEYEVIGTLKTNQEVTVTGQADTGWYRVDYNGKEGYVSNKCLANEKVAVSSTANTGTGAGNSDTSANAGASTGSSGTSANADIGVSAGVSAGSSGATANTGNSSTSTDATGNVDNSSAGTDAPVQDSTSDTAVDFSNIDTGDLEVGQEIGNSGIIWGGTFEEEWKPTTDGYGDGVDITIEPVQ